jgi:hypothetical protein
MAAHRWTFLWLAVLIVVSLLLTQGVAFAFLGKLYILLPALIALLHLLGLVGVTIHLQRARQYAAISAVLGAVAILSWAGLTAAMLVAEHETRTGVPIAQSKVFGLDVLLGPLALVSHGFSLVGLLHAEWKAARKLAA